MKLDDRMMADLIFVNAIVMLTMGYTKQGGDIKDAMEMLGKIQEDYGEEALKVSLENLKEALGGELK